MPARRVLEPARGRSYSGPSPGFSSKLGSQRSMYWSRLFSCEHRGFFPLLRLSSVLLLITRTLFCRGIEAKLNEEQGKKSGLLFISLLLGKFRSSMLAPNVWGCLLACLPAKLFFQQCLESTLAQVKSQIGCPNEPIDSRPVSCSFAQLRCEEGYFPTFIILLF